MVTKTYPYAGTKYKKYLNQQWQSPSSPPPTILSNKAVASAAVSNFTNYGESFWDYRARIRYHQSATTKASGTYYGTPRSANPSPGYAHFLGVRSDPNVSNGSIYMTGHWEGYQSCSSPSVVVLSPTLVSDCQRIWLKKARSSQRPFVSGVFLGEIRETIHMLKHPLSALTEGYLEFAKKARFMAERRLIYRTVNHAQADLRGGKALALSAHKKVAKMRDLWLENAYGWMPLYGDIDGALQAIARKYNSFDSLRVRATTELNSVSSTVTPASSDDVDTGWTYDYFREFRNSQSCRILGAIRIVPQNMTQALGLDPRSLLTDLVPTVWELIPYSFLIDYFYDVGGVIEASQFPRSDIAWAQLTNRYVCRVTETFTPRDGLNFPAFKTLSKYSRPSIHSLQQTNWDRDVYSGAYVPEYHVTDSPLSWKRWVNIAALTHAFGDRLVNRVSSSTKSLRL